MDPSTSRDCPSPPVGGGGSGPGSGNATPSDARFEWLPWQPWRPTGVSVDWATPALVVTDPDGDAETAFTFAELAQLDQAARTLGLIFEEAEVLVSVDGQTWARGDLPESSFATQLLPVAEGE